MNMKIKNLILAAFAFVALTIIMFFEDNWLSIELNCLLFLSFTFCRRGLSP